MISKRLKEFEPKSRWRELLENVHHYLWWRPFGWRLKRLKHYYGWLQVVKDDHNWEAHSIFHILHHKLTELKKGLENGNAVLESREIKSINVAIKLAKRLRDDDYHAAYERHNRKWGELIHWTEPSDDARYVTWKSRRPNAITEDEQAQEREDVLVAMGADDARQERDRRNFFAIIAAHMSRWWD